jgi:hypothetical protein
VISNELSQPDWEFLQRLMEVDFGPIAFKLMNPEEGVSLRLKDVTASIEEYRRFLYLYHLYPDRILVPWKEIDRVWHTHILDTAKYREDCQFLFGQFIDHWPYFGMTDAADRAALDSAFAETQALYAHHYQLSNFGANQ